LRLRFIKILLADGEVELLATSLLDQKRYPLRDFKKLYYKRWRIETFFQAIKSRLAVDNFTGRTVEAIKQDFFSTLFVSGLETILSAEVNGELAAKNTRHRQQVNKAISFHAIKDSIIKASWADGNNGAFLWLLFCSIWNYETGCSLLFCLVDLDNDAVFKWLNGNGHRCSSFFIELLAN
ncbi:MAG: hypothetical protein EBT44_07755, partial [Actinobacteria bacterium]|nr:hypothetical protein [Candidatus Fonsibacter lacus]